jgi:hypothetical protein
VSAAAEDRWIDYADALAAADRFLRDARVDGGGADDRRALCVAGRFPAAAYPLPALAPTNAPG